MILLALLGCVEPTDDAPRGGLDDAPCPDDMALTAGVCIDVAETVLVGELGRKDQADSWPDSPTRAVAEVHLGEVPTVFASYYQGAAACENVGKRMCTAEEWQGACAPNGTAFPWGDHGEASERCAVVDADEQPVVEALQPAGSYPECVSSDGVYDMLGNAWEWADGGNDADGLPTPAKLGGAYYVGYEAAHCGAPPNLEHPPEFDGTIAVRCCIEPDPPQALGARVSPPTFGDRSWPSRQASWGSPTSARAPSSTR